jgi:hypothetical protein
MRISTKTGVKMENYDAEINEWVLVNGMIFGKIYHDKKKRWKDGYDIRTSLIMCNTEDVQEYEVVETKNSKYYLLDRL